MDTDWTEDLDRWLEPFLAGLGPFPAADGHDVPRLIDEFVPSLAARVDDVVVGCEDPV